jgi:hypothetical protein
MEPPFLSHTDVLLSSQEPTGFCPIVRFPVIEMGSTALFRNSRVDTSKFLLVARGGRREQCMKDRLCAIFYVGRAVPIGDTIKRAVCLAESLGMIGGSVVGKIECGPDVGDIVYGERAALRGD